MSVRNEARRNKNGRLRKKRGDTHLETLRKSSGKLLSKMV